MLKKIFWIKPPVLNFIYSEKATNVCEISTIDLYYVVTVKFTVEISQNCLAFSEHGSTYYDVNDKSQNPALKCI